MNKQERKFWARMFENAPEMSTEVRQGWIDNPRALQKFLSGLVPQETELLKPISSGIVVPGTERFNAAEAFAKGEHSDGVRIYFVNENFREHFFGKTEENVPEATLSAYELTANSRDPAIITALGGEERAEVSLAHMRELMRCTQAGKEPSLQPGVNIFYVRDKAGLLWALFAYWRSGNRDWDVDAYSVERPGPWSRGRHVFSRDS